LKVKTVKDEARANGFIQAACILHNTLITTWLDVLSEDEGENILEREARMRRRRIIRRQDAVEVLESHRQWEMLVDEMLELEEDEVNVDEWTL